ncbi:hypothetical protein C6P46_000108 [Rhodotorula mucilaginosa]|uniref:Rab-GAP TBC domain-containing protein n=1 Tax=Rhodotorula mucilaginosa TaxID=5537 RepID=A0A9P6WAW2_RHOMI|nr:hypothetical protein C6P46_000108 [Rhodotorula mucilaginosa]
MHDVALSDVALAPAAVSSLGAHGEHELQPDMLQQDTSYYGDRDGWNERRHSDPNVVDNRGLNSANAEQSSWQDTHTAEDTFEAVELAGDSSIQNGHSRRPASDEHSRSSSRTADDATTTTPPHSPSLASTAPTTIASSSNDGPLPPTAPAGEPVPGPSTPPETKPAPPSATAAAAQPKPTPQKKPSKTRTVMQQVVSFTRQRNLPPKSREEEEKHLQQLAEMHAASREADRRHRAEAEARAAARNATLANAFPDWEKHILPNWRVVFHDDSQGRYLRRLWWNGTMPVRWRGRLWSMCIGNGLAMPKTAFARATDRAQHLRREGKLVEVEAAAKEDVKRTLPALKLFQEDRVMHDDLMELLLAWSVYEQRTPRYAEGLAFPAALLLLNMSRPDAFVSLVNLIHKSVLRSFYSPDPQDREAYYRVFDTLLADHMPKVYANFSSQVVRPSLYLAPWLSTVYIAFLPLDLATRIFDVFLLEGDSFAFRVALVLLQILEPRLFNPNLDELAAVFQGTDKGAVGVVRREKGLLTADGGSREETDEGIRVETEDVYTEMGATEERVFARLHELEWKEETWLRLVERELPEAV